MAKQYLENFLGGVKELEQDRKDKIKEGSLIQPIEFDAPQVSETIISDPNPDVEDNKRMKNLNERWAKMAQSRYPDDVKKQNEYIEKQRQRNETETEYVKQAVGGIFDAGNSALNFTVNRFLDEDSKVLLPEIEGPKTTGQGLVRGGVQFMIPYLGWFKVIKGATIGAKLIKTKPKNKLSFKQDLAVGTGAGVIADVVHFEANDPTLSNLIQAYPHLRNPVTEYLQTNPDDPEAVNRFKRAVEGAGLGNFFAVILRGVGHGFTKVGDNMSEKVVRHAIDKKTRPLAPLKNKKGQTIKGKWQARVNGKTVNVIRRKQGYVLEVDGIEHSAVYKTLKEIKRDLINVEKHAMNIEDGLKGSNKLDVES